MRPLPRLLVLVVLLLVPAAALHGRRPGDPDLEARLARLQELVEAETNPMKKLRATGLLMHARLAAGSGETDLADQKIKEAYQALGRAEAPPAGGTTAPRAGGSTSPAPAAGPGRALVPVERRPLARTARAVFGLEYVLPEPRAHAQQTTARFFGQTGAAWIKFQGFRWEHCEPAPPVAGRHDYRWELLDERVRAWQAADFHIQLQITAASDWAGGPADPELLAALGDAARLLRKNPLQPDSGWKPARGVKPEYLADYGAWIAALVERYDGDGRDDMPGLRTPIRYFEIESEAQHFPFWAGIVAEYETVLKTAAQALRRASPEAKVVLSGLHLGGMAADGGSAEDLKAEVERFATRAPDEGQRALRRRIGRFVEALLAMHEWYDVIEFHSLESYTEIPGTVRWLRERLREQHAGAKEVWVGDATSAPEVGGGAAGETPRHADIPAERRAELRAILKQPAHADHARVQTWYRREQAGLAVQKLAVTQAAGAERIFLCALEDWDDPFGLSMWPFHGLADGHARARPAFAALALYARTVGEVESMRRVAEGLPPTAWVFEFRREGRTGYVAWCDDGAFHDLRSTGPTCAVRLPWTTGDATLERVYPEGDEAPTQTLTRSNRALALTLTTRPIIVW